MFMRSSLAMLRVYSPDKSEASVRSGASPEEPLNSFVAPHSSGSLLCWRSLLARSIRERQHVVRFWFRGKSEVLTVRSQGAEYPK